jgi:hypothetical protein
MIRIKNKSDILILAKIIYAEMIEYMVKIHNYRQEKLSNQIIFLSICRARA